MRDWLTPKPAVAIRRLSAANLIPAMLSLIFSATQTPLSRNRLCKSRRSFSLPFRAHPAQGGAEKLIRPLQKQAKNSREIASPHMFLWSCPHSCCHCFTATVCFQQDNGIGSWQTQPPFSLEYRLNHHGRLRRQRCFGILASKTVLTATPDSVSALCLCHAAQEHLKVFIQPKSAICGSR